MLENDRSDMSLMWSSRAGESLLTGQDVMSSLWDSWPQLRVHIHLLL